MKILILGVGPAQEDLINYCKNEGHEVFGCSYSNKDRGISLLDNFSQLDIVDKEAVLNYAKSNNVDLVYSVGSDIAMPTACYVSEKLGLPHFVSSKTATICNQKHILRETIGPDFQGNVDYIVASIKEEIKTFNSFPGIIKPVDSQGQRGVFRVDNIDEAIQRFDESISHSKVKKVILEKFLEGQEISINAYFVNSKMVFAIPSDRISFDEYPGGIIKEHHLPTSLMPNVVDLSIDLANRVAKKIGIENGPAYYQIKITDNKPYLLEVTPRLDGCHMWRLIEHFTRINLLEISINHLINGDIGLDCFNSKQQYDKIKTIFICQPPLTEFKKISFDNYIFLTYYYEDGDIVKKMNGYMEKCGYYITI